MVDFSTIKNNKQIVGGLILGLITAFIAIAKNLKFSELNTWQTTLIVLSFMAFFFNLTTKLLPLLTQKKSKKQQSKKDVKVEQDNWKRQLINWLMGIIIFSAFIFVLLFYPTINYEIVYEEDFNTNRYPNSWVEGEQNEAIAEFKNGFFDLKVIGNFPISRRINIINNFKYSLVRDSSNFEIELCIKKNKGILGKNDGYGLEFRGNTKESSYYSFFINDNHEYAIQIYYGVQSIDDVITWKKSDVIKEGNFNILKVKAIDNKFSFYINGKEVEKDIELAPLGNEIGFGTAEKTAIQVDYLKLSQIQ